MCRREESVSLRDSEPNMLWVGLADIENTDNIYVLIMLEIKNFVNIAVILQQ